MKFLTSLLKPLYSKYFIFLIAFSICFSITTNKDAKAQAQTQILDLTFAATAQVQGNFPVYTKSYPIPGNGINITAIRGSVTLTPEQTADKVSQYLLLIFYYPNGNCPQPYERAVFTNLGDWVTQYPLDHEGFVYSYILKSPRNGSITQNVNHDLPIPINAKGCITLALNGSEPIDGDSVLLRSDLRLEYNTEASQTNNTTRITGLGDEFCFKMEFGCYDRTTHSTPEYAFANIVHVTEPKILWGLIGNMGSSALPPPYSNAPTGTWTANSDFYVYPNCNDITQGQAKTIFGPQDFYASIPSNAIPLHHNTITGNGVVSDHQHVNTFFPKPIQLKPGNCFVHLVNSNINGGLTIESQVNAVVSKGSHPIGFIDTISSTGEVLGWAFDPDISGSEIDVHIYIDGPPGVGQLLQSVRTNMARPDVNQSQNIQGLHGFKIDIPDNYKDGQPHKLYAYGIDNSNVGYNAELNSSPKDFTLTNTTTPICTNKSKGDANCDGNLTLADFQSWRQEFAQTVQTKDADFDGNNLVNLGDFNIWRFNYIKKLSEN